MRTLPVILLGAALSLFVVACGSGPTAPTAEQYFQTAKDNLRAMDFDTAVKNLDRMIDSAGDTPLARQGILFRAVLLTALAEGDAHMAEAYSTGSRQPGGQAQFGLFSKFRNDYYGMARVHFMNAMEAVMAQRQRMQADPVALDIQFPDFTGTDPAALALIQSGKVPSEAERYRAELECSRNALARRLAAVVGAGDDVHKGHAVFAAGGVQIDPRAYLLEISEEFLRLSDMFGPRGMNEVRYIRATHEVVLDNLRVVEALLEKKPDADLESRTQKMKADCEKRMKSLPS
jgi:hypothetical protein